MPEQTHAGSLKHRGMIPGRAVIAQELGYCRIGDAILDTDDGEHYDVCHVVAVKRSLDNYGDRVIAVDLDYGGTLCGSPAMVVNIPPQNPRTFEYREPWYWGDAGEKWLRGEA